STSSPARTAIGGVRDGAAMGRDVRSNLRPSAITRAMVIKETHARAADAKGSLVPWITAIARMARPTETASSPATTLTTGARQSILARVVAGVFAALESVNRGKAQARNRALFHS